MNKYKLNARIWLIIAFLLLTAAHYCFYRYSADPRNTIALTRGATAGCVIWTSVLLVAIWRRHAWARYLLIAMICLAVMFFGLTTLLLGRDTLGPASMKMGISGLMLYVIALVPLWTSHALNRYLRPRTAGE